ncbi:MAG: alanine dehydrogenase, partial [Proteobacteria bacterium]|nr:alanine dehydrogenase [Pseudomonadota bacterium]
MRIGVPREIKNQEYRVGLTPESVAELNAAGHRVVIEADAGAGIGFEDADYRQAGATVASVDDAFAADLVVKVKEPQLVECGRLRPGQMLFTYLHLAADPQQADALMHSGVTAIAYETVTSATGQLPLLLPMSEVAGRMSIQVGALALQKS